MGEVESFRCKLVTYDEIARWTMDVAKQVQASGYRPSVIVGLTRGGWVPARLLCDTLSVKKLYAVKTEHWGVTANQDGKALLTQELSTDVKDESVLIVDDITDTGESLTLATAHLSNKHPRAIKTSTLLHIAHSKMEPDYYSVRVPEDQWTWFIFPWNLHEDMRTLLPKTLTEARDDAGIRRAFKSQFKINVPLPLVRSTLRELKEGGKIIRTKGSWARAEGR
ncbi:MAG: phosphoribosyltransferase [Methanomassiliicoccus sp.]|nr:phosphoribosyltransferase [Methanomassiliicoccus sp.]